MLFLSLLLQCKFANSTLLPVLSFSYFITPYDAQASSAFSALIFSEEIRLDISCESSARQKIHMKKSSLIFFEG